MNAKELIQATEAILLTQSHKALRDATAVELHNALSAAAMEALAPVWSRREADRVGKRQAYYLSMEYLVGRLVYNNLYCMGLLEECRKLLADKGADLAILEDIEDDAFGNGGLGRLAACFLDSMATLELPAYGYGIRYDYGIFKQIIQNGYQVEEPDNWLSRGNPWEIRRPELARVVQFGGHVEKIRDDSNPARRRWVDTQDVKAMPYDTPIPGYRNHTVNTLRLWSAESLYGFNLTKFNQGDYISANLESSLDQNITRVLYPNDNNHEGKELRLKQQYFLVSASLQDLFGRTEYYKTDLKDLRKTAVVQLNDTHPALAIPEMMRLLIDIHNFSWNDAWDVTTHVFNYTNHTLMSEALERWSVQLFEKLLPRHLEIIYEINFIFLRQVATRYRRQLPSRPHVPHPGTPGEDGPHGVHVRRHGAPRERRGRAPYRAAEKRPVPRLQRVLPRQVRERHERHHAAPLAEEGKPRPLPPHRQPDRRRLAEGSRPARKARQVREGQGIPRRTREGQARQQARPRQVHL
jgi:starch phosphorylase